MDESVRLLNADGTVDLLRPDFVASLISISGETDSVALDITDLTTDKLVLEFNGAADGRGFSLVKGLRQSLGYGGLIYAAGHINPDQLSFAFQTGFDGVLVTPARWSDYGSESWELALSPQVKLSYSQTESALLRSIWQTRHS